MMQVLTLVALLGLLLGQAASAQREPTIHPSGGPTPESGAVASSLPEEEHNGPSPNGAGSIWEPEQGPSLNGSSAFEIGGHQGPSLNGAPLPAPGASVRGFSVESVELPDGSSLGR